MVLGLAGHGDHGADRGLGDVRLEDLLPGRREVVEVGEHRAGVQLRDHRGLDAALARLPVVVRGPLAGARVPECVVAVHVLRAGFDPPQDRVLLARLEVGAAADRHAAAHGDVDPAHGVDERLETVHVHERVALDLQAGDPLGGLLGGLGARVRDAGVEVLVVLHDVRVDGVHEALVPAVEALRVHRGHGGVRGERNVLQVARDGHRDGLARGGVHAHHGHGVRAAALPVLTRVTAHEQDVVAPVGGREREAVRERVRDRAAGHGHQVRRVPESATRHEHGEDGHQDHGAAHPGAQQAGSDQAQGVEPQQHPPDGEGHQDHHEHQGRHGAGEHPDHGGAPHEPQHERREEQAPHEGRDAHGGTPEPAVARHELRGARHEQRGSQQPPRTPGAGGRGGEARVHQGIAHPRPRAAGSVVRVAGGRGTRERVALVPGAGVSDLLVGPRG